MYPLQSRWAADRQGSRAFGEDGRAREEAPGGRPQTGCCQALGRPADGVSWAVAILDCCCTAVTNAQRQQSVPVGYQARQVPRAGTCTWELGSLGAWVLGCLGTCLPRYIQTTARTAGKSTPCVRAGKGTAGTRGAHTYIPRHHPSTHVQ